MFWVVFHIIFIILFCIDIRSKEAGQKKALLRSGLWIGISLIWNGVIYVGMGKDFGVQFFTAYFVEKLLSLDNLCIFALIFSSFKLSAQDQKWILTLGIMGAAFFRLLFIAAGIHILHLFHPLLWIGGVGLIGLGLWHLFPRKSSFTGEQKLSFLRRYLRFVDVYPGKSLYILQNGKISLTTLGAALLLIEGTDLMFAIDSVPVVFGITENILIAYTSNVCAILGLRSLYFALLPYLEKISTFNTVFAAILLITGVKMVLDIWVSITPFVFLFMTGLVVLIASIFSLTSQKTLRR